MTQVNQLSAGEIQPDRRGFLRTTGTAAAGIALSDLFGGFLGRVAKGDEVRKLGWGPLRPAVDETTGLALLNLPEGADIGKAINEAMRAIEADNEDLKDVLPRTYNRLDKVLVVSLLKNFAAVPMDIEGDAFGKIYNRLGFLVRSDPCGE